MGPIGRWAAWPHRLNCDSPMPTAALSDLCRSCTTERMLSEAGSVQVPSVLPAVILMRRDVKVDERVQGQLAALAAFLDPNILWRSKECLAAGGNAE